MLDFDRIVEISTDMVETWTEIWDFDKNFQYIDLSTQDFDQTVRVFDLKVRDFDWNIQDFDLNLKCSRFWLIFWLKC